MSAVLQWWLCPSHARTGIGRWEVVEARAAHEHAAALDEMSGIFAAGTTPEVPEARRRRRAVPRLSAA